MNNFKKAVASFAIATTSVITTFSNIKPAQAKNYDASGQWQCTVSVKDTTNRAGTLHEGSFIDKSIIHANSDGTFKAQGVTSSTVGEAQFVAQGTWTVEQFNNSTGLIFAGQKQDLGGQQTIFSAMGNFYNADQLGLAVDAGVTYQTSSCQRIS